MMQRQSALDVVENGTLRLTIHLDGNPRPSVDFRWPHLSGSSPTNVPSVQLYPFVYSSTYTLTNIPAHYCGRMVQVTLRNNLGTTRGSRSTNVTVLCKLIHNSYLIDFSMAFITPHLISKGRCLFSSVMYKIVHLIMQSSAYLIKACTSALHRSKILQ